MSVFCVLMKNDAFVSVIIFYDFDMFLFFDENVRV